MVPIIYPCIPPTNDLSQKICYIYICKLDPLGVFVLLPPLTGVLQRIRHNFSDNPRGQRHPTPSEVMTLRRGTDDRLEDHDCLKERPFYTDVVNIVVRLKLVVNIRICYNLWIVKSAYPKVRQTESQKNII